jgi:hypothetical protein
MRLEGVMFEGNFQFITGSKTTRVVARPEGFSDGFPSSYDTILDPEQSVFSSPGSTLKREVS